MRIAILSTIEQYEWAGTEEVWAQFAQLALQQGHDVHVSVHWRVAQSPRVQALQMLGLGISVRRPFWPTRGYLLKERFYSDMQPLVRFGPDVMLINAGSLFDVLNVPALCQFCDRITIPKIFFCHFVAEGFIPCDRASLQAFTKTIQGWVFVSQHNHQLAQRQLAQPIENAQVIVNGPRFNLDAPLSWPQDETIQFGCVARLETRWKGQDVLLDVLSQPQWCDRNWHLNLYGDGPDADYIQQLIDHYHLTHRVICHGYVKDIQAVWQHNHLMVLASRGEGTPLAVLEAMMCGRPAVVTDVGGNPEILAHHKTGWIADAATPASFSHTLDIAWHSQAAWADMGQQAHRMAQTLASSHPSRKLLSYLKTIDITDVSLI